MSERRCSALGAGGPTAGDWKRGEKLWRNGSRKLCGGDIRMWLLDQLAEEEIRRARERGDLDNLPNAGRPLALDDDSMVPPSLRPAYRVLRNAGYLPEKIELRREIHDAEELLRIARTEEERSTTSARLRVLLARLGERGAGSLLAEDAYFEQIRARIGSSAAKPGGSH